MHSAYSLNSPSAVSSTSAESTFHLVSPVVRAETDVEPDRFPLFINRSMSAQSWPLECSSDDPHCVPETAPIARPSDLTGDDTGCFCVPSSTSSACSYACQQTALERATVQFLNKTLTFPALGPLSPSGRHNCHQMFGEPDPAYSGLPTLTPPHISDLVGMSSRASAGFDFIGLVQLDETCHLYHSAPSHSYLSPRPDHVPAPFDCGPSNNGGQSPLDDSQDPLGLSQLANDIFDCPWLLEDVVCPVGSCDTLDHDFPSLVSGGAMLGLFDGGVSPTSASTDTLLAGWPDPELPRSAADAGTTVNGVETLVSAVNPAALHEHLDFGGVAAARPLQAAKRAVPRKRNMLPKSQNVAKSTHRRFNCPYIYPPGVWSEGVWRCGTTISCRSGELLRHLRDHERQEQELFRMNWDLSELPLVEAPRERDGTCTNCGRAMGRGDTFLKHLRNGRCRRWESDEDRGYQQGVFSRVKRVPHRLHGSIPKYTDSKNKVWGDVTYELGFTKAGNRKITIHEW